MITPILLSLMLGGTPFIGEREVQSEARAIDPQLELPAQIQAQPGQIFVVEAKTNLKWRRWTIPAGLVRVPPDLTKAGENAFVGYGPAGVYEFRLEGTKDDQFKDGKCVVFVGQPTPGPLPPNPPTPPPPGPTDPLLPTLQSLYTADPDPKKADYKNTLAAIYTTAADAALSDQTIKTTGDLFAKLRGVSKMLLKDENLRTVREALKPVCKEMENDVPLDMATKAKASACFNRCASLLQGLK